MYRRTRRGPGPGECAPPPPHRGRILVNAVPSCRSENTGEDLDCLAGLAVSSRSRVEPVK